jgi:hypothetical protein
MNMESLIEENKKLKEAWERADDLVQSGRNLVEQQHEKITNLERNEVVRELKIVELTEANKHLKDETIKDEMVTMYHIIMNDGDKYEISRDQPLLDMVQFNIGIMLLKFKEMGGVITELRDDNKHLKDELELYLPKPLEADPVTGMF